ncbi:hypothetical protein HPB47_013382 [Ixodes persulcatus]|uniref:Uncharacterized protein n=1 Tax=Ixodes persulcatus TaxID=34615 RepID=A0AC60QYM4_IXOPE|nr:hypothetical protein HPB47_013382 [Ixodes persulcatus]
MTSGANNQSGNPTPGYGRVDVSAAQVVPSVLADDTKCLKSKVGADELRAAPHRPGRGPLVKPAHSLKRKSEFVDVLRAISVQELDEMGDKTRKLRNFVEAHFSGGVNTNLWMNTFSKQDDKDQSAAGNRQLLSAEQKRQYDDQGFVVVPRLVSSTFLTQASRMDVSLTQRQRLSGEAQQKAADAMHAVLAHYRNLPEVLDWVEQFCGPRLLSLAAMFVSVPPDPAGTSKQFSLHQNSNFLPFAFADEDRVVSVWTSLDCPGDRALVVVPGTHKGPTLVHSIDDGVISDPTELGEPLALDAQPGDAVFLHPRLVHGTAPNRSERYRKVSKTSL